MCGLLRNRPVPCLPMPDRHRKRSRKTGDANPDVPRFTGTSVAAASIQGFLVVISSADVSDFTPVTPRAYFRLVPKGAHAPVSGTLRQPSRPGDFARQA